MKNPRNLICSCCGGNAIGRQWFNRDNGYGLCPDCIPFILRSSTEDDLRNGYGIRGIHFATELTINCESDMLVAWKYLDGETQIGVLKEFDNGTAIIQTPEGEKAIRVA